MFLGEIDRRPDAATAARVVHAIHRKSTLSALPKILAALAGLMSVTACAMTGAETPASGTGLTWLHRGDHLPA